jgi:hypothetical protein
MRVACESIERHTWHQRIGVEQGFEGDHFEALGHLGDLEVA